jgi:hypothetical protein
VTVVPIILGLKVVSKDLSLFSLAIRLRVTQPTVVKAHQIIIFPSGCSLIVVTAPFGEANHGTYQSAKLDAPQV